MWTEFCFSGFPTLELECTTVSLPALWSVTSGKLMFFHHSWWWFFDLSRGWVLYFRLMSIFRELKSSQIAANQSFLFKATSAKMSADLELFNPTDPKWSGCSWSQAKSLLAKANSQTESVLSTTQEWSLALSTLMTLSQLSQTDLSSGTQQTSNVLSANKVLCLS